MPTTDRFQTVFVRTILVFGGLFYLLAGAALLFAPAWFLANIGPFPPFNRHYMGDTGSFTLGMGVGLLLAARNPLRERAMLVAALVGTLLHTGNHVYGNLVLGEMAPAGMVQDLAPLIVYALLLVIAVWMVFSPGKTPPMHK